MLPADRTLIEKVAVDNGFDRELPAAGPWLAFASTQSPLAIWLTSGRSGGFVAALSRANVAAALGSAEPLGVPLPAGAAAALRVDGLAALHQLVRRAFQLARTLPNELLHTFEAETVNLPRATEAERLVVQRVGQGLFREGVLTYWEGRCAVTGLAVPELLRASHSKPWAACTTDAERLDVYNGLLLAPHLDAAFDAGFCTVAEDGVILISPELDPAARRSLGLDRELRVRGLSPHHQPYLDWHRRHVFRLGE
jgi:putative restriction endonuclease